MRAARLAFAFRQRFHKDVVIDLVCYRRHGHNEGDDPSYTQPLMYQLIDAKRSVRKLYTEVLVRRGDITLDEAEAALDSFNGRLQQALDEVRAEAVSPPVAIPVHEPAAAIPAVPTGVPEDVLVRLAQLVRTVPRGSPSTRSSSASSPSGTSWSGAARSTGHSARPWPSGRCSSRAPTCA